MNLFIGNRLITEDINMKSLEIHSNPVIVYSGLIGFVYGIIFYPMWVENVEFGRYLFGINNCNIFVSRFTEINSSFTLTSQLTGLLLLIGMNDWVLNLISVGIFSGLSFVSTSLLALLIVRNKLFSIIIPLFLLQMMFLADHYYPIGFPITDTIFGQMGLMTAILIITLVNLRRFNIALFILGIFPSIHISWSIAMYLYFAVFYLLNNKRIDFKKHYRFLYLGLLITFISAILFKLTQPDISLYGFSSYELNEAAKDWVNTYGRTRHSTLITQSSFPLLEFFKFFLTELIFFTFAIIIYLSKNKKVNYIENNILFKSIFVFNLIIVISCLFIEKFYSILPWQVEMIHLNKWLNINYIFITVFLISYPIRRSLRGNNIFANISLVLVFSLILSSMILSDGPYQKIIDLLPRLVTYFRIDLFDHPKIIVYEIVKLIILITTCFSFFFAGKYIINKNIIIYFLKFSLSIFSVFFFTDHIKKYEHPFIGKNMSSELTKMNEVLDNSDGMVLFPMTLKGELNPLLISAKFCMKQIPELGHPYEPATILINKIVNTDILGHEYTNSVESNHLLWDSTEFMNSTIKLSFEKKDHEDWFLIQEKYNCSRLIVPRDWDIQLPRFYTSTNFTIYKLPETFFTN